MTVSRLTISPRRADPRAAQVLDSARLLGLTAPGSMAAVTLAEVLFFDGELTDADRERLAAALVDPVLQTGTWAVPRPMLGAIGVEVSVLPGVTDPAAAAAAVLVERLGVPASRVATARRYELRGFAGADAEVAARLLANPVIEQWHLGEITAAFPPVEAVAAPVEQVAIRHLDEAGLAALNAQRRMALDPAELVVLQQHFVDIGREPTDVELETIAQTWSEHCSHKTFRARLVHDGVERPRSLLGRLRDTTDAIAAPFVRSAFVGNAGIISFTTGRTLALKAETHNHPSAIEPFGGANTGVGGVIRDVMGAAHRPIAVTDILCFGPGDLPADELTPGVIHPRLIESGVVAGVADYGNKIGLPTVAGAVLYDPGYTANPLVFCGAIGAAPERPLYTGPNAGDRVIVLGGRTGRDGLRGATFSSATMDASTGSVAGASVQIGDPITEKLLIDLLDDVWELISAITDCGAGGLSSAVGEMAEGIGADVELARVPLKYPGLAPWEIWLSEAQERMVVAVPPAALDALAERCRYHGVEMTDLGAFTGDGRLVVRMDGDVVLDLDTVFLHDGRPTRVMPFTPVAPARHVGPARLVEDIAATLLALLAHPNIASKQAVIRGYDHEILGSTVVRPYAGWSGDGPSDGVVIAGPAEREGFAVGIGVNPWMGTYDAEWMAQAVVDEAIRNVVAVGADPARIALLDNFSWGDPRRPSTLGELVAAVEGCCDAAVAHGAPFVSGKDSLNNEYLVGGERRSVPPTLVITAVAPVPDADACITTDLKRPGNLLVLVGTTGPDWAGSHLDLLQGAPGRPGRVSAPSPSAPARYRALHGAMRAGLVAACHDLSEGGLAVAVAEMCLGSGLGAAVDTLPYPEPIVALFAETSGRLLCEVAPGDLNAFLAQVAGTVIGWVAGDAILHLPGTRPLSLDELARAWHRAPATSGPAAPMAPPDATQCWPPPSSDQRGLGLLGVPGAGGEVVGEDRAGGTASGAAGDRAGEVAGGVTASDETADEQADDELGDDELGDDELGDDELGDDELGGGE